MRTIQVLDCGLCVLGLLAALTCVYGGYYWGSEAIWWCYRRWRYLGMYVGEQNNSVLRLDRGLYILFWEKLQLYHCSWGEEY